MTDAELVDLVSPSLTKEATRRFKETLPADGSDASDSDTFASEASFAFPRRILARPCCAIR
jgi:hypothetical protein